MSDQEPWSQWISTESVLSLYADGVERWGGAGSAPQVGCIEAALGAAYNAELYSTNADVEGGVAGLLFAGYLMFYLTTKHCFIDGNKRVGLACGLFVLYSLGLTLQVEQAELVTYCLSLANGKIETGADVVQWMAERLVALSL